MSSNGSYRKQAKIEESVTSIFTKTHSDILSQPFKLHEAAFVSYLYQFSAAPVFGVLLPFRYPETRILKYLNTYNVVLAAKDLLETFQHELWTDLFKLPKDRTGTLSNANYFIVPLLGTNIDWSAIKRAVKLKPLLKLRDFLQPSRPSLLLKTGYKTNATWKYIGEINHRSSLTDFFKTFFGENFPRLQEFVEKYRGYDPIDVLLDETFKVQSAVGFRNFLTTGLVKRFDENTVLVFAKQTKSIKHQPAAVQKHKPASYVDGTPVLIADLVSVFYLTSVQWDQGRSLISSLLEMENYTYLLEFSEKFAYQGDLELLREASTAPALSNTCNYESLETLGDTVLKTIFTLHIYLNDLHLNEHKLTRKRGWRVSNRFLTQVAQSYDFNRYLKTKALKLNNYRPAYLLSKNMPNETYFIEQKISDSMLADFIEAVIGAFYLSTGILSAGEFMVRIGLVGGIGWERTATFLSNDSLHVIDRTDFLSFPAGAFTISQLIKPDQQASESSIFHYKFFHKSLLQQSLTHFTLNQSFNYERLEFLGDAVIDIIILTNIWMIHKFDPDYLTYFKHELVSNNTLAKISFITGLYKFMRIDPEAKQMIQKIYNSRQWDVDMYSEEDIVFNMPKCLGDIFESIVAAVLIDSNSLSLTCEVFGHVFSDIILYLVKNKKRYKKRVIARLCESVARLGGKIEFDEAVFDGVFGVRAYINDRFVLEEFGDTLKNAKDNVCIEVFRMIKSGEVKI